MANVTTVLTSAQGSWAQLYGLAARTATPDTQQLEVAGYRGLHLFINCTDSADTPSVVFTVLGVDPVSGLTYTILASAAVTGATTRILRVGPGLTASANLIVNDVLPPVIRISAVHADADSITYSVGASLCA